MSRTAGMGPPATPPRREPAGLRPYRAYRAPQADREIVAIPPLNEAVGLLAGSAQGASCSLAGKPVHELRSEAQIALLKLAHAYVSGYRDAPLPRSGPLLMAGHQPELFHPGVWLKNFALGKLARAAGGTAVNLVIDTDVVKQASIPVPAGTLEAPRRERVPYDTAVPAVPFEERRIVDHAAFAAFGTRVQDLIAALVPDPCVRSFWPMVQAAARRTDRLGLSLAQARHQWEQRWGLETLELPLSQACLLPAFTWFVAGLLLDHEAFQRSYNEAVLDYRRAHRIRSQNHPVPLLAREEEWIETPFWIWTSEDPQRRRLFVCRVAGGLRLADRQGWELKLWLGGGGSPERGVEQLAQALKQGVRIRTRALTTTLFARLVLADMFVHGIGGGKYDQITDRILADFFGVPAAPVVVVSATLRLPLPRVEGISQRLRELGRLLRDLRYHGEQFVEGRWPLPWLPAQPRTPCSNPACSNELARLADQKRTLLAQPPAAGSRRAWCHAIRQVNDAMFSHLSPLARQAEAEQQRLLRSLAADAILSSREYAFCLYPENVLRDFLLEFFHGTL
ncbi:MAG: hypothetical protein K6T86_11520 [Pirellulales bacterium]|nr:hypothetical protein [Pirellulales bacterium]